MLALRVLSHAHLTPLSRTGYAVLGGLTVATTVTGESKAEACKSVAFPTKIPSFDWDSRPLTTPGLDCLPVR